MIVQESDILLAALDRRLQVDRVLAVDPLAAVARASNAPTSAGPPPAFAGATNATTNPAADLATRLPLGEVVHAVVVEVPQPDHVIAELGALRIALAWPQGSGNAPQPGRNVSLRVLAHQPMLLFENVPDEAAGIAADDPLTHWSPEALSLQAPAAAGRRDAGPVRFDVPILDVEVVPLQGETPDRTRATSASSHAVDLFDHRGRIDLDQVIVARGTALVDGVDTPLVPRAPDDAARVPAPFVPLVLQGPAWPGQPMELVVRRERKDEQLDNPVLDQWCGELVIDLPHLGRVAGHLQFSMQGLRVRLEGDEANAVDAMTAAAPELAEAFAVSDLRVSALSVRRPTADDRRPELHPFEASFVRARDG